MNRGRKEIFTDVEEITADNIIAVLQDAIIDFMSVASDCEYLLNFESGYQPSGREKLSRPDINCECVDNIANEVTVFKLGLNWGNPITLIQSDDKAEISEEEIQAISLLNKCYESEKIKKKTQELARFIEVCGIGYTIADINSDWEEGDSYFNLAVLDPRSAFIVKSSAFLDKRPILGVTFRKDNSWNYHFTCFTKTERFEILNLSKIVNKKKVEESNREWSDKKRWEQTKRSGEVNPLNRIPITEWIRSPDRTGCFEHQISEMNNLNLLISDFSNDVEQNTQAIWHGNDVEFPKDEKTGEEKKAKTNDWLMTFTSPEGKTPFIKPLAIEYDYAGMLSNIIYRVGRIKEKCRVPQRNDNSGGSTGVAMSDASGWSDAEISASAEQNITEDCKMEEVKSVLAAIKKSPDAPPDSPLLKLKHSDLKPNIKRQKTYELTVKTNAISTLLGHGFSLEDTIATIPLFEDPNQVSLRSGTGVKAYQKSIFEKSSTENKAEGGLGEQKPNQDRLSADESDQVGNSPNIDGMKKE